VEEAPPVPPRRPLLWPWLLLLLLLVGAGIALAYVLTREDDDATATDRVPAVVGLRATEAIERLRVDGYPADLRRRVDPTRRGRVLSQQPPAGTELDPGRTVVIVVARGRNTVDVPNVVGLEVDDAFERIQAAQLRARSRETFSRQAAGRVIRQSPAATEEARRGSLVTLSVSRGPRLVAVPTLIGLTGPQANVALRRAGLRPSTVRVPSREPAGTVIDQNPAAGARVRPRSLVRVNVSSGVSPPTTTATTPTTPAQATVPNVIGQDEVTAAQTVRDAGFRVERRAVATTDPTQEGIVQRQAPPPNRRVRAGSRVIIYVGRVA
jgi:beta-lactam-binding protein with PASTA domain